MNRKTCQSTSEELLSFLPSSSCINCLHLKCLSSWHRESDHNGKILSEAKSKIKCSADCIPCWSWPFDGWRHPIWLSSRTKYGSCWKQQSPFLTVAFLHNLGEFFSSFYKAEVTCYRAAGDADCTALYSASSIVGWNWLVPIGVAAN